MECTTDTFYSIEEKESLILKVGTRNVLEPFWCNLCFQVQDPEHSHDQSFRAVFGGKIKLDVRFRKFSAPENMDLLRKIKTAVLWWLIGIDLNADDDVIEWSLLQPAVQRGALRSFDWMGNLTHPYPIMLCASQIPHGLSWGLVETRSPSLIYSNSDRK